MLGRKTPRSTRKTFLRLIQFFGPYRWAFLAVIILAICSTLTETFSPAILGQATTLIADGLQHGASQAGLDASAFDFDQIEGIILTCASLYLVSGIVRYFQDLSYLGPFPKRLRTCAKPCRLSSIACLSAA